MTGLHCGHSGLRHLGRTTRARSGVPLPDRAGPGHRERPDGAHRLPRRAVRPWGGAGPDPRPAGAPPPGRCTWATWRRWRSPRRAPTATHPSGWTPGRRSASRSGSAPPAFAWRGGLSPLGRAARDDPLHAAARAPARPACRRGADPGRVRRLRDDCPGAPGGLGRAGPGTGPQGLGHRRRV